MFIRKAELILWRPHPPKNDIFSGMVKRGKLHYQKKILRDVLNQKKKKEDLYLFYILQKKVKMAIRPTNLHQMTTLVSGFI